MKLPKHEYTSKPRKQSLRSCLGDGIVMILVVLLFGFAVLAAANLGHQTFEANHKPVGITAVECQVSERFPKKIMQWCDLITPYALEAGLEPDLIAALIWYESGGNEKIISKDGAVGLMQVMPRDGNGANFDCPGGPCFKNRPTTKELYDTEYNISYGTQLLSGLIGARSGDLREALKDYGPIGVGYDYSDAILGLYSRYRATSMQLQP